MCCQLLLCYIIMAISFIYEFSYRAKCIIPSWTFARHEVKEKLNRGSEEFKGRQTFRNCERGIDR